MKSCKPLQLVEGEVDGNGWRGFVHTIITIQYNRSQGVDWPPVLRIPYGVLRTAYGVAEWIIEFCGCQDKDKDALGGFVAS